LGASFEYVNLDGQDTLRQDLEKKYNWKTIPMIVVNGDFKGGYTDVKKLLDTGKIKEEDIC
jgi:glutaredoxin-related protein